MTDANHPADGHPADSGEASAQPRQGAAGPAGWFRQADGEAAPLQPNTEPARSASPAQPLPSPPSGWQLAYNAWQESGVGWELPGEKLSETGREDGAPALPTWTAAGPAAGPSAGPAAGPLADADELFQAWQGSVRRAAAPGRWRARPSSWRSNARHLARVGLPAAVIVGVGIGALVMLTAHPSEMLTVRASTGSHPRGAAPTLAHVPATVPHTGPASVTLTDVADVADGPAGWIAVGSAEAGGATEPAVLTSADGVTWQPVAGATALADHGARFLGVAAGHGGYVVVGRRTEGRRTFATFWWSADLRTWTVGSNGGLDGRLMPSTANAVAVTPDGFIAVGSHGPFQAIWTSRDGRNWDLRDLRAPRGARSAALRLVVAAGQGGSDVVAAGYAVAGGGDIPVIVASADGGGSWHESTVSRAGPR